MDAENIDSLDVSDKWKSKFEILRKQESGEELDKKERSSSVWNLWAIVFGPFIYFSYGMWHKGLFLLTIYLLWSAVLSFVELKTGIVINSALYSAPGPIAGFLINKDYYLYKVRKEKMWPALDFFSNPLILFANLIGVLMLFYFVIVGNDKYKNEIKFASEQSSAHYTENISDTIVQHIAAIVDEVVYSEYSNSLDFYLSKDDSTFEMLFPVENEYWGEPYLIAQLEVLKHRLHAAFNMEVKTGLFDGTNFAANKEVACEESCKIYQVDKWVLPNSVDTNMQSINRKIDLEIKFFMEAFSWGMKSDKKVEWGSIPTIFRFANNGVALKNYKESNDWRGTFKSVESSKKTYDKIENAFVTAKYPKGKDVFESHYLFLKGLKLILDAEVGSE